MIQFLLKWIFNFRWSIFNSLDLKTLYSDEALSVFDSIGYGNTDIAPITGINFTLPEIDPTTDDSSPNTLVQTML